MMNSVYSDEKLFVKLDFLNVSSARPQMLEDVQILHVVYGTVAVGVGKDVYSLTPGDFLLVNANTVHEISMAEGTVCGRFLISIQHILSLLGKNYVKFSAGINGRESQPYTHLETTIWSIYEALLNQDRNSLIQRLSLYYKLVEILTTSFLDEDADQAAFSGEDERDNQIIQFIRANYTEAITLDSLAKSLFLSNAYLSKYIKKRFKMNYVELLNAVRMSHAVEVLKYSNDSVTRVALTNGFSSVASFNRIFKDSYGVVPSDYRKAFREQKEEKNRESAQSLSLYLREKISDGIRAFRVRERVSSSVINLSCTLDALSRNAKGINRKWKKMINAGTAYDLTRSDYQTQLVYLKEHIGFEYVRFWDVFSPELRINIHAAPETANFSTLFLIIDFLIDHNIRPFLELAFKPIRILKNPTDAVIDKHRDDLFSSPDELRAFISEFVRQLVSRYGQREVSSWYFEYWKIDPLMYYVDARQMHRTDISSTRYFNEFDALASGIRSILPQAKIGGGGFTYRSYGDDGIRTILRTWNQKECKPDFISLNCFQYNNIDLNDNTLHQKRHGGMDFINCCVEDTRRIMREEGFGHTPVFVTEFDFTVSNRCVANDSCNKAAQLMQTLITATNHAELLSYWTALDAYAEYTDTKSIVFGGVGLLSKDGIPKPSFFTYEFLNRLDDEILEQTEDYIISRLGTDSFKVVCHNFRGYTDDFYETDEDKISIRDFQMYSADQREKHIHLTLQNIPNGKYQIRFREVDTQSGSIQGIWKRLNYDDRLDREDVAFIRQMCVPSMWRMEQEVVDGTLSFDIRLAPNSIKYAHFILRKG